MTATAAHSTESSSDANAATLDMKLEVVTIPVADFDRAKAFYEGLGWRLDADFRNGDARAIQLTPPGSPCSIQFGRKGAPAAPGTAQRLYLVVSDIEAAREDLMRRGVAVSEVFHFAAGPAPFGGVVSGPAPGHASYASYATFTDPDDNGWLLQEITTRFPGRIDSHVTTFASVADLASALRRVAAAHGEHEQRIGAKDADWPAWYAAYLAAEQSGAALPT